MSDVEIAVVVIAAVVSAFIKAITGAGFPLLVVPVLALFIDVADAIVVVSISSVTVNASMLWSLRDLRRESPTLPRFLFATSIGAVIGSSLLSVLSETVLRVGLISVIVLFVANRLSKYRYDLPRDRAIRLAPLAGGVSGIVFGATAVSGPLVTPWFLSQNLSRDVYLMSIAAAFTLASTSQVVFFGVTGAYTPNFVLAGSGLVIVSSAILPFGTKLRNRLPVKTFEYLVLALLIVSGILLLASIV